MKPKEKYRVDMELIHAMLGVPKKLKSDLPIRVPHSVNISLTTEEADALCEELWRVGEDERLTPILRNVYNRISGAKNTVMLNLGPS